MAKKKATLAGRAWNLLRLALFWARKGGVFGRGLAADLRLAPNYLKRLRAGPSDRIHYGEREFSFDETPVFHFKMHRPRSTWLPRFPCINPPVDFDDDDDRRGGGGDAFYSYDRSDESRSDEVCGEVRGEEEDEEEGVDLKAEEFIAKFYEQMRFQRQVSFLQYNEMLLRGTS